MDSIPLERKLSSDEIRSKLSELGIWYHQIDLGHGILTPGLVSLELLTRYADVMFKMGIANLSVLDVGAWNGFFSFEAERRGAARTLAVDKFCWSYDPLPNYPGGREQFELAKGALGSKVEDRMIDIPEMTVESMGHFDLVLFNGIVYHILDPINAIINMSQIATKILIIETAIDCLDYTRAAMVFYPAEKATLEDAPQNGWGPNPRLMHALLKRLGFETVLEFETPGAGVGRSIFIGFKPSHGYDRFIAEHVEFARPRILGKTNTIVEERIVAKIVEKIVEKIVVQEKAIERLPEVIGWRQIASYVRMRILRYFKS